jgi:CRP/FNR family cyclic AMP-dependent transcriptional regulator
MISDVPLFTEFFSDDLEYIASRGVVKTFLKNTVLINEGDRSDALYVILEGKVKVYASDENGKEVILNIQGPGEYFGELALIDDVPRSASVMTLKPSRLASVSRESFEACLVENPRLALKLVRSLSQRILSLTEVVKNLALHDVYGRVTRTLCKLAREQNGRFVIEQRLTHQDIADMVGASREMVSRIMKDLSTGGYIKASNKMITINGKLPPAW